MSENRINIFKILNEEPGSGNYRTDNTEDYNFQNDFRGKFIIVRFGKQEYFVAVGKSDFHHFTIDSLKHILIYDFLEETVFESEESEVFAGGKISIYPQKGLIIAYGWTEGFNRSFKKDQIIPSLLWIKKQSAEKINKVICFEKGGSSGMNYDGIERRYLREPFLTLWNEFDGDGNIKKRDGDFIEVVFYLRQMAIIEKMLKLNFINLDDLVAD